MTPSIYMSPPEVTPESALTRPEHDLLATRARRLIDVKTAWGQIDEPASSVALEIALVLDHLDRWGNFRRKNENRLLGQEMEAQTRLDRLHPVNPDYLHPRDTFAAKLRERFVQIDNERQRLASQYEDKVQPLRKQLLTLMIRYAVLGV